MLGDGLEMVREIRAGHGDLPVLVLPMHDPGAYYRRSYGNDSKLLTATQALSA